MKKLITLLLVLTGMVSTASADDFLKGSWDWDTPIEFSYDGLGTATVSLAAETTYQFGFQNGDKWYRNAGTMTDTNCIGWKFETGTGNAQITTTIAGNYTFKVQWKQVGDIWYPYISVAYPTEKQYVVHFKIGDGWSSVYAYRYFVTTDINDVKWPGTELSENTNNAGYYDVTFSDTFNRITFSDNGSDTNKSGDVTVNFSYPETWVTNNYSIQTTAPDNWVGYTRNVTSGKFGTICLPFAATVEGATIFKIASKTEDGEGNLTGINLESVESLEAGKPYIFKATGTTLTATYSGSYTDAIAAYGMVGNLSSSSVYVPENAYIVGTDNLLHKVAAANAVTIGQYKGYIDPSTLSTGARGLDFIGLDNETAGIANANVDLKANQNYYNLNGQRVAQPAKGLYIMNGKKVIIK